MFVSIAQTPALDDFIVSISEFSHQEKFFKWESYLQTLKQKQSQFYQAILERFVEYYPFNHTYWSQICQLAIKVPKTGKGNAVRLYQLALAKNPRSINLWKSYLGWLQKEICKSDPNYLKKQYEKATKIIGNHYKAGFIFENYLALEEQPIKKYNCMKKALVSPLQQIDKIYDLIATYIETSQELTIDILKTLVEEEGFSPVHNDPEGFQTEVRGLLKCEMRKLYEPTKKHVEQLYQFESKLPPLDQYRPYNRCIQVWRNYINFIKNSGNHQFLTPIYQRALITNCDNESLWQDYFMILQSEGNQNRALYLLRSHAVFFRNFSRQITYNWLQLQQRENHNRSRQLYIQLQKSDPNLDIFMRHIQMELRYKEYQNARIVYQTILTTFTTNVNIIGFVVLQFAEFALKYFRDIDTKKMLRNYFDSYPFHLELFFGILQFYIKNVELKQNSKEGKQISDQFLSIIIQGLKRALNNNSDQYKHISKVARKLMRNYITSIYVIKLAERKITEMEIQVKKQQDLITKRVIGQDDRAKVEEKNNFISPSKHRNH